jgi:tetratricopeptide (TPR) repeat protein
MRKIIIIFCFILFNNFLLANKVYDFNITCQQAYQDVLKLKFVTAKNFILKAKQQNPENLIPLVLENYIDFFTLFFNEDPLEYKRIKPIIQTRIDELKDGDEKSPWHLYYLGILYLQEAAVEIKFGENWNAAWNVRHSYLALKENKKKFASFTPNDLVFGSLQAIIGTIPKGYKWLTNLLGLKGSVNEGMLLIKNFLNNGDGWSRLMSTESTVTYCFLQFHLENKKEETIQFIQSKKLDVVNNHLFAYMAANLTKNNKQPDIAKEIILNRNKSVEYFQTPVWDFELGFDYLYRLDFANALEHFEKFTSTFKGKFYLKDVYEKISWCYYLQGNKMAAENARKTLIIKGSVISDADKQAMKDATSTKWPNSLLLKVRLLCDGGHAYEALDLLNGKTINNFSLEEDKVEFTYRTARIYDDINRTDDAIKWYIKAIELGENRPEYFAARAALQTGIIYEKRGDKTKAINYYKRCLEMNEDEYKNSIDQKAKSGIARCKGE